MGDTGDPWEYLKVTGICGRAIQTILDYKAVCGVYQGTLDQMLNIMYEAANEIYWGTLWNSIELLWIHYSMADSCVTDPFQKS